MFSRCVSACSSVCEHKAALDDVRNWPTADAHAMPQQPAIAAVLPLIREPAAECDVALARRVQAKILDYLFEQFVQSTSLIQVNAAML